MLTNKYGILRLPLFNLRDSHIYLDDDMTDANTPPPTREIVHVHVTHPDRDNLFRIAATPSDLIKKNVKTFGVQCTQCQKTLDKPLKCSKVPVADIFLLQALITYFCSARVSGIAQKR